MGQETAGLTLRIAGEDSQAFDGLMGYCYPRTLRVIYLMSGSRTNNEGTVQEAFMLCRMNREKIKEPEYFGNWLYKTLTREAQRYCRKNRKE